ncbi:MAG: alpha/beta hydrolase [Desulfarculaceae bacterium]|nr:alpha/beta hydrolase [Desulfarculaceae bacterium]MCF8048625.1 alpha/beta hydrolase [Desulfarculaceae bacterium]MCF8063958.1 alpha/beta hydrolase [Desulfarculaceae bacterium]MCF8096721.1 alpha/beta hydrolase [Desulfarculaceae bacterium]MCF8123017.1 alpha/beta hydrolase [Desulfarculaceae bacterium]
MARPFENMQPALTRLGPPPETARREVLFIHGAWGGAWVWDGLAQDLAAEGYGVNLIEQPGHGADRWVLPSLTSINDYADLSRRAAASLGRPVLVGHSLGGWQVQKIWEAEDLPGVLLAPLPGSGLPWRTFLKLNLHYPVDMSRPLVGLPVAVSDTAMARRVLFKDLDEAALAERVGRLAPEPSLVCLQMAALLGLGLGRPHPRPGRRPRLVVAPAQDYLFPPAGQKKLAQELGARYVELEGLPHELWVEDREGKVKTLLLDFLNKLD